MSGSPGRHQTERRRKEKRDLNILGPLLAPAHRPRNADLNPALLWGTRIWVSISVFCKLLCGFEQIWALLSVGANQDKMAVLLSPPCFTNPLQYGPGVGVLCGWAGRPEAEARLSSEAPPSPLPAQSECCILLLPPTSSNSVAFLFFLQGPPGLPGPPGPPGPPGAVVNIKGVS